MSRLVSWFQRELPVFVAVFLLTTATLHALPQTPQVVEGVVTFDQATPDTLNITASDNSIIEYSSFDINQGETVNFFLPTVNSFSLNRVLGPDMTNIAGTLTANGNIILVNVNGFNFGSTASLNVGGLIASTHNISNADFLNGNYIFAGLEEDPNAYIVNKGMIKTRDGGMAILISDVIDNQGTVEAPLGTVALSAGKVVTVGITPDNLISIGIDEATAKTILDSENNPITQQIKNSGDLKGQTISLKAEHLPSIFQEAMNLEGVIRGDTVVVGEDGIVEIVSSSSLVNLDLDLTTDNLLIGPNTQVKANDSYLTVHKDWDNRGTFQGDLSTVEFKGPDQTRVLGDNTFYNFKSLTPNKVIAFEATKTQTILGTWKIQGAYAQHVRLISTQYGSQWKVDPKGPRDLTYSWIQDSHNISPQLMIITESTSRENNTNWDPTLTWNGAGTNWSTGANWNGGGGSPPGSGDDVVFDGTSTANATIDGAFGGLVNTWTITAAYTGTITASRSIQMFNTTAGGFSQAAGTVTMGANEFDTNDNFLLTGGTFNAPSTTMRVGDDFSITGGTFTHNSGTIRFDSTASFAQTFDSGGTTLNNIVYEGSGGSGSLTLVTSALTLAGDLTNSPASGSDWDSAAIAINMEGNFSNTGDFTAPSSTFNVAGDFANTGTFTHNSGDVILDGTSQAVTGDITFDDFTKSVATADTITFEINKTITVVGTTTMNGASGQLLSIRSSSSGTRAKLDPQGTVTISFVDVKDNENLNGTVINPASSTDSFNNIGWFDFIWDGSTSTDWNTGSNWSTNSVPTSSDGVEIPDVANDPILATSVTVVDMDITGAGATVTLAGNSLTVSGAFTSIGTVIARGSETLTLTNDVDSGTWEYVGDADALADTFTITDFGATDYFNLTINMTDAADIGQLAAASVVAGALTVSGGTFDLDGENLTVTGTVSNTATIQLTGQQTVTLTNDTDSGIWEYVGDNDAALDAIDLDILGYHDLVLNAGDGLDSFRIAGTLTAHDISFEDGAFRSNNTSARAVTATGDVLVDMDTGGLSGGTITITQSGTETATMTHTSGAWEFVWVVDKSGGILNFASDLDPSNDVTFTAGTINGGAFDLDIDDSTADFLTVSGATYNIGAGGAHIGGGFLLSSGEVAGSGVLTIDGLNAGTFEQSGGTLTVDVTWELGTVDKSITGATNTITFEGDVIVNGTGTGDLRSINTTARELNFKGNFTHTGGRISSLGGQLTFEFIGTTQTLTQSGSGTFNAVLVLNSSSTLTLVSNFATTNSVTLTAGTFNTGAFDLDIGDATADTLTVATTVNINASGAILAGGNVVINTGALITGTLTIDGVTGATFTQTGGTLDSVKFSLGTVTKNFAGTTGTITIPGTLTIEGSTGILRSNGTPPRTINLTGDLVMTGGNLSTAGGLLTFEFNGTSDQDVTVSGGVFQAAFFVNHTVSGDVLLQANFSPVSFTTFTAGTFDLNGFTFSPGDAAGDTVTINGGTLFVNGGSLVLDPNVTFSSGTITGTVSFGTSITSTLTYTGGTFGDITYEPGSGITDNINSTVFATTGTVTFSGAGTVRSVNSTARTLTFGNFTQSNGDFGGVGGILTLSFTSTGAQSVNMSGGTFRGSLDIDKSSGTLTATGTITILSSRRIDLDAGTFDLNTNSANLVINSGSTFDISAGTLTVGAGSFKVAGTFNQTGGSVTGLTEFNGSVASSFGQSAGTIDDVLFSHTSGEKSMTLSLTFTISGDLTFNMTGSATLGSINSTQRVIELVGNLTVTDVDFDGFLVTELNGTGAQTISQSGGTFDDTLEINKASGTATLTTSFAITSLGSFVMTSGTFALGSNTFDVDGAMTQTGGAITGTITLSSTFTQSAGSLTNIIFDNSATRTISQTGTGTISGNVTVNTTAGELQVTGDTDFVLSGNLTLNITGSGVFGSINGLERDVKVGGNLVVTETNFDGFLVTELNGTGAQTVSQVEQFFDDTLEINKASGTVTLTTSFTITAGGSFVMTSGTFALGANTFDVNGTMSQTGGAITGTITLSSTFTQTGGSLVNIIFDPATTTTISQSGSGVISGDVTVSISASELQALTDFTIGGNFSFLGAGAFGSNTGVERTVNIAGDYLQNNADADYDNWILFVFNGTSAQTITITASADRDFAVRNSNTSSTLTLTTAFVMSTIESFTNDSGATFVLNGNDWGMGTTLFNDGTIRLDGSETISNATQDTDSGTWEYVGDNDGVADTLGVKELGPTDYFNLTIVSDDTGANVDTFQAPSAMVIAGAMLVSNGTYDADDNTTTVTGLTTVSGANSSYVVNGSATQTFTGGFTLPGSDFDGGTGTIDIDGDLTIGGGTYTATSGTTFLEGDFIRTGGTFNHNSGTFDFDGTLQTISGSSTFNNFTKSVATADTFTFTAGTTQTVEGTLTLNGASGQLLSLRSSVDSSTWFIDPTGTRAVSFVDVKDSTNNDSVSIGPTSSTDSGNNVRWFILIHTWDGSTDTDFGVAANWDTNQVPNNGDSIIIANVANKSILERTISLETVTINSGGIFFLDGEAITITAALFNNGTLQVRGDEAGLSSIPQDKDSGAWEYVGRNVVETVTIVDFGATDYYDLIINDTNTNKATYQLSATQLMANDLTVTSSAYDTNANNTTVQGDVLINGGTYLATSGTHTYNGDFTLSSGTFTEATSTAKFVPTQFSTKTITGTITFYKLTFDQFIGTSDIANTITVLNDLNLASIGFHDINTGTLNAQGDIYVNNGGAGRDSTATLNIDGTGAQSIFGNASIPTFASLPDVVINKASGTLTYSQNFSTANDWTHTAGTVAIGTGTILFNPDPGETSIITGSQSFYNLELKGAGSGSTITIPSGTTITTVDGGTLSLSDTGLLTLGGTGALSVEGHFTQNLNGGGGSTPTLTFTGTANQTFTGGATSSDNPELPNIVINKSGGTLTLVDTIRVTNDWTYTAGTFGGTGGVEFNDDLTITGTHTLPGPVSFGNSSHGKTFTLPSGTEVTATGDVAFSSSGANTLNGPGTLKFLSDLNAGTQGIQGTATVIAAGTGGQAFNDAAAHLPNFEIDKASGTLTIAANLSTSRDWTHTEGTVSWGSSSLTLRATPSLSPTLTPGSGAFNDLIFDATNVSGTYSLAGIVDVAGALSLTQGTVNNSGSFEAQGDVTIGSTYAGGTAALKFTGTGAQSFTPNANFGAAIEIDKASGTVNLQADLGTDSDFTVTSGTFDTNDNDISLKGNWSNLGTFTSGTGKVAFTGGNQTISGTTSFYDIEKIARGDTDTLTFAIGATQTITRNINFRGAGSTKRLRLRSASQGTDWGLNFTGAGTATALDLDVEDSDNTGTSISATGSSILANSTGWTTSG